MNRSLPPLLSCLLSFIAGAVIHLGFAPYNLWLPALAGLSIFATLISLAESGKMAFKNAFCFGAGLFGAGVNWVYVSIHIYGEVPAVLAFIFTAGFALFLALVFALPWLVLHKVAATKKLKLLCFPAFWFFSEWLRGWLLTGFPWLYLGYAHVEGPLSGWIPLIGVLGTGALLTVAASLLVYVIDKRSLNSGIAVLTGLIVIFGVGVLSAKTEWTSSRDVQIPITLVQPDIPLRDKWNPAKTKGILEALESNSQNAWQPGLLIWPEAAIPYTGPSAEPYIDFLDELSGQSDTAMITGLLTYDYEQNRYLNSIVGLGSADNIYHKQRLVPFGEYVPLENWLRGTMKFFDLPMSVISAGPAYQSPLQFNYQGQTFGLAPAICYEIAYTDLVRSLAKEADMLVTLSNDAWFGASIGPWQHMQIAQARALENQKPLARVTNNGITGLVNHHGAIVKVLPQFTRASLSSIIEPRSGTTPYTRYGNWLIILLIIGILAISIIYSGKVKRRED